MINLETWSIISPHGLGAIAKTPQECGVSVPADYTCGLLPICQMNVGSLPLISQAPTLRAL
ncbi:hypothetical protein GCM10023078_10780 [Gibbsiella greigii]